MLRNRRTAPNAFSQEGSERQTSGYLNENHSQPISETDPAAALTLTGCGSKAQPANTKSLVFSHHYKLDYAQQFTADCYEGGYTMLTIAESDARFLVVPEDAAEVDGLPADVTVLRQPVENIYLVSTSVMDLLLHLDALDSVAFSGTKAEAGICRGEAGHGRGKIAYAASTAPRITSRSCGGLPPCH